MDSILLYILVAKSRIVLNYETGIIEVVLDMESFESFCCIPKPSEERICDLVVFGEMDLNRTGLKLTSEVFGVQLRVYDGISTINHFRMNTSESLDFALNLTSKLMMMARRKGRSCHIVIGGDVTDHIKNSVMG